MTIHVAVDRALKLTLIPEKMKRFGTVPVRAADPIRKGKRAAQYLLEYRKDLSTDAPEKTLLLGPDWWEFLWTKRRVYRYIRQEKWERGNVLNVQVELSFRPPVGLHKNRTITTSQTRILTATATMRAILPGET